MGARARRDCTLGIYAVIALFMIVGSFMPGWIQRIGPFMIEPYAWAFGVLVVPNLIFIGAFCACSRSRRAGCWWCSSARWRCCRLHRRRRADERLQYDTIARLIDPFGGRP